MHTGKKSSLIPLCLGRGWRRSGHVMRCLLEVDHPRNTQVAGAHSPAPAFDTLLLINTSGASSQTHTHTRQACTRAHISRYPRMTTTLGRRQIQHTLHALHETRGHIPMRPGDTSEYLCLRTRVSQRDTGVTVRPS